MPSIWKKFLLSLVTLAELNTVLFFPFLIILKISSHSTRYTPNFFLYV